MSIYIFECDQCDTVEELDFPLGSQVPMTCQCPLCRATMRRQFNRPNIHFRGSGFYQTDKWQYEPENPLDSDEI